MRRAERRRRMKAHRRAERNRADDARRRQPREIRWVYPKGDFEPLFQAFEQFERMVAEFAVSPVNDSPFFGVIPLREAYRYYQLSSMPYVVAVDYVMRGDAPQGGAT